MYFMLAEMKYIYIISQIKEVDRYCGLNPKVIEEDEYKNINKTKDMPHYPDDGSIKIIDGVVVVKY